MVKYKPEDGCCKQRYQCRKAEKFALHWCPRRLYTEREVPEMIDQAAEQVITSDLKFHNKK